MGSPKRFAHVLIPRASACDIFGRKIFTDVIQLKLLGRDRPGLFPQVLNPTASGAEGGSITHRTTGGWRQRSGWYGHPPRSASSHQGWGEAGKELSPSPMEGAQSADTLIEDFGPTGP